MTEKGTTQKRDLEMKLELVPIPVRHVDAAKAFYVEKVGFNLDHDVSPNDAMRVVQLTPPGSGCSVLLGTGMGEITDMTPGSVKGLHLVVSDIAATRDTLISRGVSVGEVQDMGGFKFAGFNDPDGNAWLLQEIAGRA